MSIARNISDKAMQRTPSAANNSSAWWEEPDVNCSIAPPREETRLKRREPGDERQPNPIVLSRFGVLPRRRKRVHNGRMRQIWIAIVILLIAGNHAVAGNHDGWSAFERGDYAVALQEFQRLAEQGDVAAQYNLAILYATGKGVTPDPAESLKWFQEAAATGDAPAQFYLGYLYSQGKGVKQDHGAAAKWYFLAATRGNSRAQFNLGRLHYMGMGVPKDYVRAYKWFSLAASQGVPDAIKGIDIILKKMSPDDILKAKGLAATWKPNQDDVPVKN